MSVQPTTLIGLIEAVPGPEQQLMEARPDRLLVSVGRDVVDGENGHFARPACRSRLVANRSGREPVSACAVKNRLVPLFQRRQTLVVGCSGPTV